MTAIMTAIGIGWGITWFTYAADYSRFVSTEVPKKKVYLASVLGQFIPVVWLGVLGASLATKNGDVDPGQLIVQNFGGLAIPVLLLVVHGPIATNILNIYTFSVATQALDVKIPRRTLSVLVGVLAMVTVVFFVFQGDFASVLDTWLVGLVAWVATWGGIMLVHYYRIERGAVRVDRLFDPPGTSRLPNVNWAGYVAFFTGILSTWLFMYGLIPFFQGPIAVAMGGVDLSWLAGGLASAGVYAVLGPIAAAKYEPAVVRGAAPAPRTPAEAESAALPEAPGVIA
jgi:toxin CptA